MSASAGVAITTVLSILVILGTVGNCLVCAIIKRNRDMRYFEKIALLMLYLRYQFSDSTTALWISRELSLILTLGL